jgi:hypothetical protein
VSLVFLVIVLICVLRSLTIVWKICLYIFGVWILRSALLRSTTLNPVDHLEHLISKVNWVNFEINSVLPSLLLVLVEKVLTCLFTPPSRQLSTTCCALLQTGQRINVRRVVENPTTGALNPSTSLRCPHGGVVCVWRAPVRVWRPKLG